MRTTRTLTLGILLLAAVVPLPAAAGVSIAGGAFIQNKPALTSAAAILSTGTSVPTLPLDLQGSLLVPLTGNGGYALTFEVRGLTGGGYGGAYIGAGAGVGNLAADRQPGTVLTVFAGKSIAPLTSVEIRFYEQMQDTGASSVFVGLRFGI